MYYNGQRSKTSLYVLISLLLLIMVILWGQGFFG